MNTNELIRQNIERLHAKGGGDWESLMREVDGKYTTIPFNTAQMLALLIADHLPKVKHLDLEWGRGTGKTTVVAGFTRRIARNLPRGCFQWEVPTYQKFLTEIIPAYIHALEMQGLYKDLHYFIGRRPPARWRWPEPYKPPVRYDNFITFYTGFGINLLSQDNPGAGRGLSTDGRFADEAAMLDPRKLDEDSGPAIRGSNTKALGEKRFFDFRLMMSSTALTESGAWFIKREEMAQESGGIHAFLKANCAENIKLGWLKADYLIEAQRTSLDRMNFEAEYLNIRPKFIRGGFYNMLDETQHTYTAYNYGHYTPDKVGLTADCRGDSDLVADQPLTIGMDFGAAINSLVVCQQLPGEFRVLKDFFVKGAEGQTQDDLCRTFNDYYQYHQTKIIRFYYDATGNHQTGNTKVTRAQQVLQNLQQLGWRIIPLTVLGTNPRHFEKYRLWEKMLAETDARFPRFRLNKMNAKTTFISMTRAKSKSGANGEIKKDKSSERVDNPNRQFATDLSDALDNPVFMLYNPLMRDYGTPLPEMRSK
jgi:hypothetical protein